jgi:hypothetical protein
MKRNLLILAMSFLAMMFALMALSGCSDNNSTGPDPTATPSAPTPTPSPTPMGTGPWVSGRAVVNVIGASVVPGEENDKGIIFGLAGPECEVTWTRLRARNDAGGAWYQSKLVGSTGYADDCWGETNYYLMQPSADGDWTVVWGTENGGTWVRYEAPNGTSETVNIGYVIAFDHVLLDTGCTRPPVASGCIVSVISFAPDQVGSSQGC